MKMETKQVNEIEEVSLIELFVKIKSTLIFLHSKRRLVILAVFIGCVLGLSLALYLPKKYISKLTFVVEEGNATGGSLASLAGQFGLNIGGAVGAGGVFSGDNVLLLLKSERLVRSVLLTIYDSTSGETLADRYIQVTKLKKKWEKSLKTESVSFSAYQNRDLPRKEDSILQLITLRIIDDELIASKPDKNATFIEVKSIMQDENLSKLFSERLVKFATDLYLESKIKVKSANIAMMQRKADSLGAILNNRTYSAAVSQQVLVDANPGLRTAPISAEISTRDKVIAGTMFSEVVKNLEMSKTLLNQETPVIQMVDQSSLPLEIVKLSIMKSTLLGGVGGLFLVTLYLMISNWFNNIRKTLNHE